MANNTTKLLNSMKPQYTPPTPLQAVATDMFLPNHSGDHSKGHTKTPTNDEDLANKKYVDDQFPVTHASTTGKTPDDHHAQSHSHASHTGIGTDDHHVKYTDAEAVSAVATADDYLINDGDDTTTGTLTAGGFTTIGTITGEQITSTDDITMAGILTDTMGVSDTTGLIINQANYTGTSKLFLTDFTGVVNSAASNTNVDVTGFTNTITNHHVTNGSPFLVSNTNIAQDNSLLITGAHSVAPTIGLFEVNYGINNALTRLGIITATKTDIKNYGIRTILSAPVIGADTVTNYGEYISVIGSTNGTTINYGIYLDDVSGADTNWAYYNDTPTDNFMGKDNSVAMWGTTNTDLQISSDGTNGIIDVATSLRLGNNATNYMQVSNVGVLKPVGTAAYQSKDGSAGASGSFTTVDSKTVTVKDGLITAIV
jgi:hypothetical protein